MPEDSILTHEQEELRLRGLRILARMIAQAHMRDMAEVDGVDGASLPVPAEYDPPLEERPDVA